MDRVPCPSGDAPLHVLQLSTKPPELESHARNEGRRHESAVEDRRYREIDRGTGIGPRTSRPVPLPRGCLHEHGQSQAEGQEEKGQEAQVCRTGTAAPGCAECGASTQVRDKSAADLTSAAKSGITARSAGSSRGRRAAGSNQASDGIANAHPPSKMDGSEPGLPLIETRVATKGHRNEINPGTTVVGVEWLGGCRARAVRAFPAEDGCAVHGKRGRAESLRKHQMGLLR